MMHEGVANAPRQLKAIRVEVEAMRMRLLAASTDKDSSSATVDAPMAPMGSDTTVADNSSAEGSARSYATSTSASVAPAASATIPAVIVATTHSPAAPSTLQAETEEAPMPGLSADLKQSISRLVDRVKLMANPDDLAASAKSSAAEVGGVASASAARRATPPGAQEGLEAPTVKHVFARALQAVQEFKEHTEAAIEERSQVQDTSEAEQEPTTLATLQESTSTVPTSGLQTVQAPRAILQKDGLRPVHGAWTGSPMTSPRQHCKLQAVSEAGQSPKAASPTPTQIAPAQLFQTPGGGSRRMSGSVSLPAENQTSPRPSMVPASSPQAMIGPPPAHRVLGAGMARSPSGGGSAVMPSSMSVGYLPSSPVPPPRST